MRDVGTPGDVDVPFREYRYGDAAAQVCELYLPPGSAGDPRAVAVLVHGGFWRARYDRSQEHAVAADLVRRGWAVWNVDYRGVGSGPSAGGGWTATFEDVAAAVDLLADVAHEVPLPMDRVAVLGHSAGGQLALGRGPAPAARGCPGRRAAGASGGRRGPGRRARPRGERPAPASGTAPSSTSWGPGRTTTPSGTRSRVRRPWCRSVSRRWRSRGAERACPGASASWAAAGHVEHVGPWRPPGGSMTGWA